MKTHNENLIQAAALKIADLTNQQNETYDELAKTLNLIPRGEEYLFDYIYNSFDDHNSFDHYLERFNFKLKDLYQDEQS